MYMVLTNFLFFSEATAADTDGLRDLVEKISEKIAETHNETSIQLRELISRHHDGSDIPSSTPSHPGNQDNEPTLTTDTTASIVPSSSGFTSHDLDDRTSIGTTATTISLCSIRSFTAELKSSRAFKRVECSKL